MKVYGITGGVGSGKSMVLDMLKERTNSYIIKADEVANMLMTKGHKPYDDIVMIFGEDILDKDGNINKTRMSDIIFNNENKRLVVNSIVHPQVKKWITEKIGYLSVEGKYDYIFVEAALLIEDHYDAICDELWYIYASEETRVLRLSTSRGYTTKKTKSIIKSQKSDDEFRARCNRVIDNSGDIEDTFEQIKNILSEG